jgi:drug/metabolite transporter (DMT)-like permease
MDRWGSLYALGAAILFGASTPLAKGLLHGISPWLLAGLFYLGAGIGLGLLRLIRAAFRKGGEETSLGGKDWHWLGAATFIGGFLAPVALMAGLKGTDPASASLLLNVEGLFTVLLAWIFFGEEYSGKILVGALLLLAGAAVISWTGAPGTRHLLAPALVVSACLGWAMDNNLTRRIASGDALQIAMLKNLVAGAGNTALALMAARECPLPTASWGKACLIGFVGYGLSLLLFIMALRRAGAARTGALFSCAPCAGAAVAVLTGMEVVTGRLLAGGLLSTAGAILLLPGKNRVLQENPPTL